MKYYEGCYCGRRGDESCKALTPRTSSQNPIDIEEGATSLSPLPPRQGKY